MDEITDGDIAILIPKNFRPQARVLISIDPRLLELGATFTSVVEAGDIPKIFLPGASHGIPANSFIRGYLL